MTTRRSIVKAGAGLAAIIAAGKAPAALVRSLIAARNALMASKSLPYDAEVEYLESTGTQWIATGIYGTQNTIAHLRGCNLDFDSNSWGFGSRAQWGNSMFALYNGQDQRFKYVFGWGNNANPISAVSSVSATTGNMVDFVIAQQCSVDGQVLPASPSSAFRTPRTLRIFGAYINGSMHCGKWRFSNVKITVQGVLVRDFIPVRFTNELGQSEGAMFDRANPTVGMNPDGSARDGGLYRNAGTGAFVIGPDKSAASGGGISINA